MTKLFHLSILYLVLNLISSSVSAQKILTVNFEKIDQLTSSVSSNYYYPSLLKRFILEDTTLTKKELHFLYYGQIHQKFYKPQYGNENQDKLYRELKNKNFDKALEYGLKAFEESPLEMKTIFGLSLCYMYMSNDVKMEKLMVLYYGLMQTIIDSGNGKKIGTAYVVMHINDEYEIINSLNKISKKHKLIKGITDFHKLKDKDCEEQCIRIRKLYFNIQALTPF